MVQNSGNIGPEVFGHFGDNFLSCRSLRGGYSDFRSLLIGFGYSDEPFGRQCLEILVELSSEGAILVGDKVIERLPGRALLLEENNMLHQGSDQNWFFGSPSLPFAHKVQKDQPWQPLMPGLLGGNFIGVFSLPGGGECPAERLLHKERTGIVPVR
jgi:hypothetical protein